MNGLTALQLMFLLRLNSEENDFSTGAQLEMAVLSEGTALEVYALLAVLEPPHRAAPGCTLYTNRTSLATLHP